jgi:hypothetical protein
MDTVQLKRLVQYNQWCLKVNLGVASEIFLRKTRCLLC